MTRYLPFLAAFIPLLLSAYSQAEVVVDFEGLPVDSSGYYNGDIHAGSPYRDNYTVLGTQPDPFDGSLPVHLQEWHSAGVNFRNEFAESWSSWAGASWSQVQDSTTPGFGNQYAAFPGGGSDGAGGVDLGGTYAVAYSSGYFTLPSLASVQSIDIANTTYAALSMRDGDTFAEPFGGPSGDEPDYLKIVFTGYDDVAGTGNSTGTSEFYLADYRFADNLQDYILDQWAVVDLTGLGEARSLAFTLESTDFGTPTYFAFDNLTFTAVPEPNGAIVLTLAASLLSIRRSGTGRRQNG